MKTCPHCMEEIPEKARKCRYCGEWVTEEEDLFNKKNDIDDEDLDDDIDDDFDDDIDDDFDDDIDDDIDEKNEIHKTKGGKKGKGKDIGIDLSGHEINNPENQSNMNKEDEGSNKHLIMAIIGGVLLIIAFIKLSYILWGVILLVAGVFLIMPYYIDRFTKK